VCLPSQILNVQKLFFCQVQKIYREKQSSRALITHEVEIESTLTELGLENTYGPE